MKTGGATGAEPQSFGLFRLLAKQASIPSKTQGSHPQAWKRHSQEWHMEPLRRRDCQGHRKEDGFGFAHQTVGLHRRPDHRPVHDARRQRFRAPDMSRRVLGRYNCTPSELTRERSSRRQRLTCSRGLWKTRRTREAGEVGRAH